MLAPPGAHRVRSALSPQKRGSDSSRFCCVLCVRPPGPSRLGSGGLRVPGFGPHRSVHLPTSSPSTARAVFSRCVCPELATRCCLMRIL